MTFAPIARSLTRLTNALAAASETSASSSATRTSRSASLTSPSLIRPRPLRRSKIAPRRSWSWSNKSSLRGRGARRRFVDALHRVADGFDLLRFLVWNIDIEFSLERHHQLDLVERIGTEIVGDRCFGRHFGLVDPELLDDDLLHFIEGGGHYVSFRITSKFRRRPRASVR